MKKISRFKSEIKMKGAMKYKTLKKNVITFSEERENEVSEKLKCGLE